MKKIIVLLAFAAIDVMSPITNLTWDMFFSSIKWKENIKKFLDLTLNLLNPFISSEEMKTIFLKTA